MFPRRVIRIFIKMKNYQGRLWRALLCYILRCLKINPNKIVFSNFCGNGYGDNPKYIAEEIIRQNLNYDLVWLLREEIMDKQTLPSQFRIVKDNSIRAIYELVTAMFWVDNLLKAPYIKKRKGQYNIFTAHGGPSLKKLEEESYAREFKRINLFLSNSSWYSTLVKNRFGYNGEILEFGAPRNDVFFDQSTSSNEKVRKYFGISHHHKIVLYVPTWRNNHNLNIDIDVASCLKSLSERFSGDWIFMIRLHPNLMDQSSFISGGSHIINATEYEDVQELLTVVDAVMTDYSSIMFDFAIRRSPVFLYTPDVDDYRQERGFYIDFKDIPFTVAKNNVELSQHIKEFNLNVYIDQVNNFFSHVGSYDNGGASKALVSWIKSHQSLMSRPPQLDGPLCQDNHVRFGHEGGGSTRRSS